MFPVFTTFVQITRISTILKVSSCILYEKNPFSIPTICNKPHVNIFLNAPLRACWKQVIDQRIAVIRDTLYIRRPIPFSCISECVWVPVYIRVMGWCTLYSLHSALQSMCIIFNDISWCKTWVGGARIVDSIRYGSSPPAFFKQRLRYTFWFYWIHHDHTANITPSHRKNV